MCNMEEYYGYFILVIILNIIFGDICLSILSSKGYGEGYGLTKIYKNNGFWWGFFLGVIGIIVCALKPDLRFYISQANARNREQEQEIYIENKENLIKDENDTITQYTKNQTIEQIKEYKKLLDDGAITEEEYNQIKKNILNLSS